MTKPLPCPKCGNIPPVHGTPGDGYHVSCLAWGCHQPGTYRFPDRDAAVEAWNRQVNGPTKPSPQPTL